MKTFISTTDGRTTWINASNGVCIARAGTHFFEIYENDMPIWHSPSPPSLDDWYTFKEKIFDTYRYEVKDRYAPLSLRLRFQDYFSSPYVMNEYSVPVNSIITLYNPLHVESFSKYTLLYINDAIINKEFEPLPSDLVDFDDLDDDRAKKFDARRIAYLMNNQPSDPIEITICSKDGHIQIRDGHHRLYAAYLNKQDLIPVLFDGIDDDETIRHIFSGSSKTSDLLDQINPTL